MDSIRRAVIDIGTNSVKLLVAEVEGHSVIPLLESSEQTRLGRGFYQNHLLQPKAIAQTAEAVAAFVMTARQFEAKSIVVVATSAVRDALNQATLLEAIKSTVGLQVQILSGHAEARLSWLGVRTHPRLASQPLTIVEVGGGSTQIISGSSAEEPHFTSFNIGAVRVYEQLGQVHPMGESGLKHCRDHIHRYLEEKVRPILLRDQHKTLPQEPNQMVGIGGTSSVLACMALGLRHFDRDSIESIVLTCEDVQRHLHRLWNLSLEERRKLPGLPANRADIILTGVAIFAGLMDAFGYSDLMFSTRGLRFAAVLDAFSS